MGYEARLVTRTRTLDSHVSRLRSKLEREPGDHFVVNVWGVGYSSRNRFCLVHRKTGPVDPMHYRKDGPAHRALRAHLQRQVAAGGVQCARCGELIELGSKWDLGHRDGTLSYAGPEHARCNRATASHRVERDGWWDPTSRIW